jgi:hypothetical protein
VGFDHLQRESGGDRGIEGIAAFLVVNGLGLMFFIYDLRKIGTRN